MYIYIKDFCLVMKGKKMIGYVIVWISFIDIILSKIS